MADLWQSIVDGLAGIATNPLYLFAFITLIILLMLAIVVHHIRKVRNQEPWIHQAWGANWKGRNRGIRP